MTISRALGDGEVVGLPRAGSCLVPGILNVTPDSFSDGGRHLERRAAIERGFELAATGPTS
jgi:dihydropteroate synthase